MIPAKSHSSAKVSFYPFTENPSGEVCTAYAAAYMSLDQKVGDGDYVDAFVVVYLFVCLFVCLFCVTSEIELG